MGTPQEKRKIAGMVLSNPVFKDGSIEYDYGKPFDQFVNVGDLENWMGWQDSNLRMTESKSVGLPTCRHPNHRL